MSVITMKQLLEAGVHFGHQKQRWNPKMKPYIYDSRNDIHIIDLQITAEHIEKAYQFVHEAVERGANILFVGKKKQAQDAIKVEAERCGMFYVNNRWLGGTLTNFEMIKTRIDKLHRLDQREKMGEFEQYSKKEAMKLRQEKEKLELDLGGIKNMRQLPDIMFVVDLKVEETAIKEARKLNIPIVGLVDTNCDPDLVDYVIPGNDDAIRAIRLISGIIADAAIAAKEGTDYVAGSYTEEAYLEAQNQREEASLDKKDEINVNEIESSSVDIENNAKNSNDNNLEKEVSEEAVEPQEAIEPKEVIEPKEGIEPKEAKVAEEAKVPEEAIESDEVKEEK